MLAANIFWDQYGNSCVLLKNEPVILRIDEYEIRGRRRSVTHLAAPITKEHKDQRQSFQEGSQDSVLLSIRIRLPNANRPVSPIVCECDARQRSLSGVSNAHFRSPITAP